MKLLIVEDSEPVSTRLRALLASVPALEIVVAGTLASADDTFRQQQSEVVILDIQLPDGNGIDLLKAIKRERPTTRVLMFSNHVACHRRCRAAGADGFFDKASDFEALTEAVHTLAQDSRSNP